MDRYVISLFDKTGNMVKPWVANGYKALIVDNAHPIAPGEKGFTVDGNITKVNFDLVNQWLCPIKREQIVAVFAFPPCDDLASSGAQWFKGKGLRALAKGIHLVATAVDFCNWSNSPYMIENPMSTLSTYWREPDFKFHPYYYTKYEHDDNYFKKTCLWTGNGFVMPKIEINPYLDKPYTKIHSMAMSQYRKALRSETPLGFAHAVYKSNKRS